MVVVVVVAVARRRALRAMTLPYSVRTRASACCDESCVLCAHAHMTHSYDAAFFRSAHRLCPWSRVS